MFYRHFMVLALLLLGCANARSEMVGMWADPENPPASLKRFLVVSLWDTDEPRSVWEGYFARALSRNGVRATPSYDVAPVLPDSAGMRALARQHDYDGVIVVYPNATFEQVVWVPEYWSTIPLISFDGPQAGLYDLRTEWVDVCHPAHYEKQTVVRCDVDVLMADDRIVWAGTTDVIHPTSYQFAAQKIADRVVFELSLCGIVPAGL